MEELGGHVPRTEYRYREEENQSCQVPRTLKRALKDGHITEDEEEMLSEFREHLDITQDDHEEMLRELGP